MKMTQSLSKSSFETRIQDLFEELFDALTETCGESCEDLTLDAGVLTICVSPHTTFVITKHAPTSQIWLSSPLSGAWHFSWNEDKWMATKDDRVEFFSLLDKELSSILSHPIGLMLHVP